MKGGQRAGTAVAVVLEAGARERLVRMAASPKSQVRAVLRAEIVLAAADGLTNGAIVRQLEAGVNTVRKWRGRFAAAGSPAGTPPMPGSER